MTLYKNTKAKWLVDGTTDFFNIDAGVLQGDTQHYIYLFIL